MQSQVRLTPYELRSYYLRYNSQYVVYTRNPASRDVRLTTLPILFIDVLIKQQHNFYQIQTVLNILAIVFIT